MLATLKDVLEAAREGRYAVGAFNIVCGLRLVAADQGGGEETFATDSQYCRSLIQ